MSIYRTRLR